MGSLLRWRGIDGQPMEMNREDCAKRLSCSGLVEADDDDDDDSSTFLRPGLYYELFTHYKSLCSLCNIKSYYHTCLFFLSVRILAVYSSFLFF